MMNLNGGLAMMMRSFGFDPNEIMEQVEQARKGAIQMVQHFDGRLRQIEEKQNRILAILEAGSSREPVPMLLPEKKEEAWKQSA